MHVLIVDDSPPMRRLLARAVVEAGFEAELTEASSGVEALARLAERRFDLMLCDLHMPEMDGLEVLGRIQRDPALSAVPVVMVTTETEAAALAQLVERGARACLSKPFTLDALRRAIETALGR